MTPQEAYEELAQREKDTAYLSSTTALLHWDQRTQIPPKGHSHRINQLTFLARLIHNRRTDPRIGELLAVLEKSAFTTDPLTVEAVNIREWKRLYERITKIPEKLAVELARAGAEGEAAWERARPANDWAAFKPYLERLVELKRQQADAYGYDEERYDALLDDYEQGATTSSLEPVLKSLQQPLVQLLDRIQGSAKKPDPALRSRPFPVEEQERFARAVAEQLGFDFSAGRLDVSAHPFTTGIGPGDVRITTRYQDHYFNAAFFGVIHEAGHAMYHQGLPVDHWGQPLCRPISLGINESQSRLWENMVARSRAFWRHFYPQAQERFDSLRDVPMDDFLLSVNEVAPNLIRVEADEVTYNLHILLRFELEVALMRDDLRVDYLPDAWNEKMSVYLGLTPPDYAQGVMQDVHWSGGSIGYFPTYTLGNLYGAQFFAKARVDLGDLEAQFERGEFSPLLGWLRNKIHSQGSRYLPRDLLRVVTGEDLEPRYLIEYLEKKYGSLYGL
ncbi:MAG: carboxypeptidase M32 [Thermodesulfobacteriota bacterium]